MKQIIPAIDLKDGNVVRLLRGKFSDENIYDTNPLTFVDKFHQLGCKRIHVVNLNGALDGSFEESPNYLKILEIVEKASSYDMKVQIGGGIRTSSTVSSLLSIGVANVILGSIAVSNSALVKQLVDQYDKKIIVSLDSLNGTIKTSGWTEESNVSLIYKFQELQELGVRTFVVTDISKDGTLEGSNKDLYRTLGKKKKSNVTIIASGGIKDSMDIESTLDISDGVIFGKAYYSGSIKESQLSDLLLKYNPTNLIRRIIPCLDVKNGRVVKGVNFQNLRDSGDPVELASYYNAEGADELVFLDITATLEGRKAMLQVIKDVAEHTFIPLSVGGGIKTLEDMTEIIKSGAEKVAINSSALQNPDLITQGAKKFGSQCIVVAIDVKKIGNQWIVFTNAGTRSTGRNAIEWAVEAVTKGAGELLVTSMDRDGTKSGYDTELLTAITSRVSVPVIASGGAGTYEHFKEAIDCGAEAVLAASLFHYKELEIRNLKNYLAEQEISVRL